MKHLNISKLILSEKNRVKLAKNGEFFNSRRLLWEMETRKLHFGVLKDSDSSFQNSDSGSLEQTSLKIIFVTIFDKESLKLKKFSTFFSKKNFIQLER